LWDALIAHASAGTSTVPGAGYGSGTGPGVLDTTRLGQAARDRGLYRYAAALWTAAAGRGSADAAGILAMRAAGAGMFGVFLADHPGGAVSYRYGREQGLAPAPPWRWAPPGPQPAGSGPAR
jgi:hypothetical protein